MLDRTRVLEVAGRTVRLARAGQVTLLAAGVAYYAFISFVPLALLVVSIAVTVGGESLASRMTLAASDVLTPTARRLLAETLVDVTGRRSATVVGALGLLWGASRVLDGLDRAFSAVYGTVAATSIVDTLWNALLVSVAITVGLGAIALVDLAIRFVPVSILVFAPVRYAFVLLALFVAFLPVYVVFPDADVGVREAIPGTVVAALGWFLLSRVFAVYAAIAGEFAVYGALGAVFLVLVWLYVAAVLVVLGAVLNAVLAGRDTDRQLQSPGPCQFPTEAMTDDDPVAEDPSRDPAADRAADADRARDRTRDRADDPEALREEIERLRDRLESFEDDVDRRTVRREELESDLKRYVRRRVRRGHARGWGPYLVLLYGTAMSVAAFYFLSGGWAILAMFVVWTSTLGVYVLMVLFGAGLSLLGVPGRVRDRIGEWRS